MEETLETFNHFINEVLARKIAYIQLVRYLDVMDPTINGAFSIHPHVSGVMGKLYSYLPRWSMPRKMRRGEARHDPRHPRNIRSPDQEITLHQAVIQREPPR